MSENLMVRITAKSHDEVKQNIRKMIDKNDNMDKITFYSYLYCKGFSNCTELFEKFTNYAEIYKKGIKR